MLFLRLFFLVVFFQVFCFSSSVAQHTTYQSLPVIRENEAFSTIVKNRYSNAKKEMCSSCSSKEMKIIKEILNNQKESSFRMVEKGDIIFSGPLYDFVQKVQSEITKRNFELKDKKVVILRKESLNAFTMGQDIIYIHSGLLYYLQNEHQLAYILCHEFAHDVLRHSEQKMINYAKQKTDKELEKQIKETISKKYGVVSGLNELMLPYMLASKKESRNFEFEADSLALIYFANTDFDLKKGCTSFDLFLRSKPIRDTLEIDFVDVFKLNEYVVDTSKLKYKESTSSLGEFTVDKDTKAFRDSINALLRTHPFEEERIERLYAYLRINPEDYFDTTISEAYQPIRYWSEGEMVNTMFFKNNIGKSLFYAINMNRNYPEDKYAQTATILSLAILSYYKSKFKEGKVVDNLSDYHEPVYNRFLQIIKDLSPSECNNIATHLETTFSVEYGSLEYLMYSLLKLYTAKDNNEFRELYEENQSLIENSVFSNFGKQLLNEVNYRK